MISALRWLTPRKLAQFCLRCGAEFQEPEHVLCARCLELAGKHGMRRDA